MSSPRRLLTIARLNRHMRKIVLLAAAVPVLQATGCFPDPIGALNFQLQSLINTTLIDWVSIIVSNIFRL
jgi:hypothetical protein